MGDFSVVRSGNTFKFVKSEDASLPGWVEAVKSIGQLLLAINPLTMAFALGGCAPTLQQKMQAIDDYNRANLPPSWINDPPKGCSVGKSWCFSQEMFKYSRYQAERMAEMNAMANAMNQQCKGDVKKEKGSIKIEHKAILMPSSSRKNQSYIGPCLTDGGEIGVSFYLLKCGLNMICQ